MPQRLRAARYWWRVVSRSFRGAWNWTGHSLKKWLYGGILLVITGAIRAFSEWNIWAAIDYKSAVTALIVAAVAFFLIWVFHFILTPSRMEEDAAARSTEESAKLTAVNADLQAKIDHLTATRQASDEGHAAREAELRTEAEVQRRADPKRNVLRQRVSDFFAECKSLCSRIQGGDVQAVIQLFALEHQADTYLQKHLPGHPGFNDPAYPVQRDVLVSPKLGADPSEYLARCQARAKKLEEVLALIG
jgi:hypothetical protein